MQRLKQEEFKSVLYNGTPTQIQDMLSHGAMPDLAYAELHGNTPIHLAAYNKWPDNLKILLDSLKKEPERLKRALEATNDNGVTPLFEAIWVGRPPYDFAKTKPSPSDEELEKFKTIFYARMKNMPKTVQVLLDAGANLDSPQKGFPGGKGGLAYTTTEWLKEQLSWQDKNPDEKDPRVKKALEKSLKIINQHSQQKILKRRDNQNA